MDAIELWGILPNGKKCSVWACGKCNMAARTEQDAKDCCAPRLCACGEVIEESYCVSCKKCRREKETKADEARYTAAEKVPYSSYDGPGFFIDGDDHFFEDLETLFDHYRYMFPEADLPRWAWGAVREKLSIDSADVIESILESSEWFEEAADYIPQSLWDELRTVFEKVENEIPACFRQTFKTIITFEKEAEEYEKEESERESEK